MSLITIHKLSFCNEDSIRRSKKCGCFYCKKIFDASEMTDDCFIAEPKYNKKTAWCPYCNIDSVLGDFDIPITPELLDEMHTEFFVK